MAAGVVVMMVVVMVALVMVMIMMIMMMMMFAYHETDDVDSQRLHYRVTCDTRHVTSDM